MAIILNGVLPCFSSCDDTVTNTLSARSLSGSTGMLVEVLGTDLTTLFWQVFCLRDHLWQHGVVWSAVVEGKNEEGAKFADYFDAEQQRRLNEIVREHLTDGSVSAPSPGS